MTDRLACIALTAALAFAVAPALGHAVLTVALTDYAGLVAPLDVRGER